MSFSNSNGAALFGKRLVIRFELNAIGLERPDRHKIFSWIYETRDGAKQSFMDSVRTCDLKPTEFSVGHTLGAHVVPGVFRFSKLLAFDSPRAVKSARVTRKSGASLSVALERWRWTSEDVCITSIRTFRW
jgi:hypothetical protein